MLDIKSPTIIYRPIRPSDLEALEQIHAALFPVRYERDFFLNVVTGQGIISWAAVDISRPDGQGDELIGFVTTRVIAAKDSEIEDLIRYDVPRKDQTLVYILTLGVAEHYRNLGVATSLVREVINYASSITNCQAVYLHVISYNNPAIHFYKKMLFKLIRRLTKFYYINGQHYDSYLFVYYVNGSQSPCSPLFPFQGDTRKNEYLEIDDVSVFNIKYGLRRQTLQNIQGDTKMRERDLDVDHFLLSVQIVAAIAAYIKTLYRSLYTKIWKNEKQLPRWSKGKENTSLLVMHNSRIVGSDSSLREV